MRVMMITPTLWAYEMEGQIYRGSRKVVLKSLLDQGFTSRELEYGVSEMLRNQHNVADFGVVAKLFIFSKRDPEVEWLMPFKGAA